VAADDALAEFVADERKVRQILLKPPRQRVKFTRRAGGSRSRPHGRAPGRKSPSATPGSGSRRRIRPPSSRNSGRSGAPTRRRARARGSGWPWPSGSWSCTAARSASGARSGRGDVHLYPPGAAMAHELILIIEDHEKNRKFMREVLQRDDVAGPHKTSSAAALATASRLHATNTTAMLHPARHGRPCCARHTSLRCFRGTPFLTIKRQDSWPTSRRPFPSRRHNKKLVFPSNYTHGFRPPAPTSAHGSR